MKRIAAALCAALFVLPAAAEETEAARVAPARHGYAFDSPRYLTQQLLWGLAHGVRLLANACRESATSAEVATAYVDWLEREKPRIDAAVRDLGRFYFGREEITLDALTGAMGLKPLLELAPERLEAACASFVAAIGGDRYDLDAFYTLRQDAARLARAEAVRQRVQRCRESLPAEVAAPLGDAFILWEAEHGAAETLARTRLATALGDTDEARTWRDQAGAGAVPPAVACPELAAELAAPSHSVRRIYDDE